jgi:hypothetical protein
MKSTCGACNRVFASLGSFDMHRVGSYGEPIYNEKGRIVGYTPCERRCLTEIEMRTNGMIKNERGHWTTGVVFDTSRFANKEAG